MFSLCLKSVYSDVPKSAMVLEKKQKKNNKKQNKRNRNHLAKIEGKNCIFFFYLRRTNSLLLSVWCDKNTNVVVIRAV